MGAYTMMNRNKPGIASPYEGVGDQAVAIGPTLMIRRMIATALQKEDFRLFSNGPHSDI
jgi:hypothetical protein